MRGKNEFIVSVYEQLNNGTRVEVFVQDIMGTQQVSVTREHSPKMSMCHNFHLNSCAERKQFMYFLDMLNERYTVVKVWFGNSGSNFYPFERYKNDNNYEWLKHLQHETLNR